MKVFLVSQQALAARLFPFFQEEGMMCDTADRQIEASEKLELQDYDCVLLELQLFQEGSWKLLEDFVATNKSGGMIILSENPSLDDKLHALDSGADDFVAIPFDERELLARIKAVVRRKRFDTKATLRFGNLVVDLLQRSVKVWDKDLNLTKKEYEILLFFLANKGKVISKTTMAEYLWGNEADSMDSFNLLVVHLKNLRKKLQLSKAELEIKNIYGVGYQIIEL